MIDERQGNKCKADVINSGDRITIREAKDNCMERMKEVEAKRLASLDNDNELLKCHECEERDKQIAELERQLAENVAQYDKSSVAAVESAGLILRQNEQVNRLKAENANLNDRCKKRACQIAKLRLGLKKYGSHVSDCNRNYIDPPYEIGDCTCGYSEALSDQEGGA